MITGDMVKNLKPGRMLFVNATLSEITHAWHNHGNKDRYGIEIVCHTRGGYLCRVYRKPKNITVKAMAFLYWLLIVALIIAFIRGATMGGE